VIAVIGRSGSHEIAALPDDRVERRTTVTRMTARGATLLLVVALAAGCSSASTTGSATGTDTSAFNSESTAASIARAATTTSVPPTGSGPSSTVTTAPTAPTTSTTPPAADASTSVDDATTAPRTCGTDDLGGGLVVTVPCDATPAEVEGGARAAVGSVLLLPDPSLPELEPVDVTARQAHTPDGHLVTIYVFGSDTLFDSGTSSLRTTAEPALTGALASIAGRFGTPALLVRGHADSVGAAGDNQALSDARAHAVGAFLESHGVAPDRITTVGLGSTVPAALETAADGSVSELGRQLNRRVELVVISAG